jgi:hypothetical protein
MKHHIIEMLAGHKGMLAMCEVTNASSVFGYFHISLPINYIQRLWDGKTYMGGS